MRGRSCNEGDLDKELRTEKAAKKGAECEKKGAKGHAATRTMN